MMNFSEGMTSILRLAVLALRSVHMSTKGCCCVIGQKSSVFFTITPAVPLLPLTTLLLCVQSNSLLSQEPSQQIDRKIIHETVEAVAAVIKAEYFDSVTAERTSDALHERLAHDRYANTRSLEHLADNLTRDLLHLTSDKHLVVAVKHDRDTESLPTQKPSDESREFLGRRAYFGVQRVEVLPGNIGYLNLTSLYRPDEAREAITAAFRLLRNSDAIILDLRNNGGGSPDTAVLVLSYFFEKEGLPLFEIVSRSGSIRSYKTDSLPLADRNHTCPVFVLTSARTFSAGEGLAFVLQERGRAQIIGETTAGAANPGRSYPTTTGVEVTVPNGKVRAAVTGGNWEGSGVVPDIKVAAKDALRDAHTRALRELHNKTPNGSWKLRLKQELDAQESKERTSLAADQPQEALRQRPETGTIVGRVFAFQNPSLTPDVRVESFELFIGNARFKSGEVKVDEEGRFVFKDVPSGRVRLQPTFSANSVQGIRLSSSLTFSTTVRSGQTREVALFGKGRPVRGQILVPPGIDAKKLRLEFVLVAPPVRAMFGPSGNKPTPLAHVYERLRKEAGDLSSSLDEHGRFRIEGVREGTYWINVTNLAFASKETPGYPSIEGGKLKMELMAGGESDDPLELGVLRFTRPVRAAER